jgi:alcohol dehydrogenase
MPNTPENMLFDVTGRWEVRFDESRLVFGSGELDRLGEFVRELGCAKALIVTDAGLRGAGHVDRALQSLDKASVSSVVFDRVDPNPSSIHVEAGREFAAAENVDCIVGLGGGSAMDCAKGVNFVLTNGGTMEDYWGNGKASKDLLPSIGIPTTAGTGSDAQSYALIGNGATGAKMACGDRKAKFRVVILDDTLTRSLPLSVAGVAGVDAISHAVESYVCTRSNPISRLLGRAAWNLIDGSFEATLTADDSLARGSMLLGSHLAGAAIEHSMLGAAHACANPLTAHYQVIHGVAVGLVLPHVMTFNAEHVGERYDELCPAMPGDEAGEALRRRIMELRAAANLPLRLSDCSVPRESLNRLAGEANEQWTARFNPRPVTTTELLEFYEAAY